MIREDDRTPEQKQTHTIGIVARDKFMSGWGGASGGASKGQPMSEQTNSIGLACSLDIERTEAELGRPLNEDERRIWDIAWRKGAEWAIGHAIDVTTSVFQQQKGGE